MKRRAFLASATAVASGGCLGRIREDARFVVDAETVSLDEGVIHPQISVVDPRVNDEHTATVDVSLRNESFQRVRYITRPADKVWIGAPYSNDGTVALTETDNIVRRIPAPETVCWGAASGIVSPLGSLKISSMRPLLPERRRFGVVASENAGCLSPGTYRFEPTYEVWADETLESTEWRFEIRIEEA